MFNTKIGFLNIIWIYVLCERVLVTDLNRTTDLNELLCNGD